MIIGKFFSRYTIAIRPGINQVARKITKIIGLNGDGFSVITPYHKARSGFLFKAPADPAVVGNQIISIDQLIGFTVDARAKLTYHTDGFAQFSSERKGEIISGIDPITRKPKGLGLFAPPLTSPIWTGASIGITVWGLDDFEPLGNLGKSTLIFEPHHFHYRACSPIDANGWHLEIYAFPKKAILPCRWDEGHLLVDVAIEPLHGRLVSVKRLSIIRLPKEEVSLGIVVNRMIVDFSSASGWVLSGPGDWTFERKGHVLEGIYPIESFEVNRFPSIERNPATSQY
jgi:hypothetical protein